MPRASDVEGMPAELDLFLGNVVQTAIKSSDWRHFKTTSALSENGPLVFFVSGTGDQYVDLGKTILHVVFKIVKHDGTAFEADANVSPVNNFLNSMFQDVKIEMNNKVVYSSGHNYHYRALIEDLFNYNNTAKKSHLTAQLFVMDTANQMDSLSAEGLVLRRRHTVGSRECEVAGRIHADLMSQNKLLLNEVDIRFTFSRNLPEVCLMGPAGTNAKVVITDATLLIRKVEVSPDILIAHSKSLSSYTAKYPFKHVEVTTSTLNTGTRKTNIENLILGRLPTRVILGFVSNLAYSGSYTLNPYNFKHFNVDHLAITVNGSQVMSKPFTPNFDTSSESYILAYLTTFWGTGNHLGNDGWSISRTQYKDGYTLFAFDFTPDLSASESHWTIQSEGNLKLDVSFKDALTEAVTLIVYAEYRDVMEIDKNRECEIEYKK